MDVSLRDQLAQACLQMEARPPQPLYVLLYDQEALVTLAHPKRHAPYASDLALVKPWCVCAATTIPGPHCACLRSHQMASCTCMRARWGVSASLSCVVTPMGTWHAAHGDMHSLRRPAWRASHPLYRRRRSPPRPWAFSAYVTWYFHLGGPTNASCPPLYPHADVFGWSMFFVRCVARRPVPPRPRASDSRRSPSRVSG